MSNKKFKILYVFIIVCFYVSMSFAQTNCTVNAGANASWCGSQGIHLDGHVAGVIQGGTQWKQISGFAVTIQDPSTLQTDIVPPVPAGTYVFELSASCGQGMATQQVTHTVQGITKPDAGSDLTVACFYNGSISLTPMSSPPIGYTAEWTLIQGSGYVSSNQFYPTVDVNVCPPAGDYLIQLSYINKNACRFSDTLKVHIDNFIPDIKTELSGGGCAGGPVTISGTCPGANGTIQWNFIKPLGGGGATFSSPNGMGTQINNTIAGQEYIVEYQITNGSCGSKSIRDTFIAPQILKNGTAPVISTEGYEPFNYNGERVVVICNNIPDSILFSGNLPNFPEGEKVRWEISPNSCDIWTLTVRQPNPSIIEISKTQIALVNLKFGIYEIKYTIATKDGCGLSDKIKIAILPDGHDITYTVANNCEAPDFSKFNIGCRKSSGLDAVMTDAYYHFPVPSDLIPIVNGNINYIVDGLDFKPINNPTTVFTTKADMCFNNTTHRFQYFINISKDAPTGTYIYEIPVVYSSAGIPSCNGSKARFIIDLSSPPDTARGGTDQLICGSSTGLAGNTVKTPEWKFLSVTPPSSSIPSITSPNSIVTNVDNLSIDAEYRFLYKSYGGEFCGSTYDTVWVRTAQFPPPQPNAGPDQTICSGSAIRLNASPSPIPSGVEGFWTIISQNPAGPSPIFSSINDPKSVVSGLQPNTVYTFRFTLRNGCDKVGKTDDVIITTNGTEGAYPPSAGNDKCLPSGTTSITLAASTLAPAGVTGRWTAVAGNPPGASISSPTQEISTVTGLSNGTYRFLWTVSKPPCPDQSDTVTITIGGSKAKVKESLIKICNNASPLTATLEAEAPQGPGGKWIQIDGASTAVITAPTNPITTVNNIMPGIYKFLWTIDNGVCSSSKEVEVRVGRPTPIANAGADAVYCPQDSIITLSATPAPAGMLAYWSVEPISPGTNSAGVDFLTATDITNPTARIRLKPGRTRLRWNIIADPVCGDQPSVDDLVLDYVPDAKLPQDTLKLCDGRSIALEATYPGVVGTGSWTQISGPAASGIPRTLGSDAPIIVGLSTTGVYVFEYCVSSASCSKTCDRVTVINSAPFMAPAFKDRDTICTTTEILLKGGSLQQGQTARWEYIRGPVASWQIKYNPDAMSNATAVTPVQSGTYLFRYIVSNGGCEVSTTVVDSVRVGIVDAGKDLSLCSQTTAQLPAAAPGYRWTYESGGSSPVIIDPNSGSITGIDSSGTYLFRLTAPDGCYDLVKVDKLGSGILISDQPDSIKACEGATAQLSVTAAASFGSIRYQWQSSSNAAGPYTNVGSNTSTYNPTLNSVGTTYYRVILTNNQNNCSDTSVIVPSIVVADPGVSSMSRDTALCEATTINLQGIASGGILPLTYQWQSGTSSTGPWTDINGAKNSSYNATLQKGKNYYRLQIQSQGLGCTDFQSNGITITVDEKPSLSLDLKDKILCLGALDSLHAIGKGNNITYDWSSSTNASGPFSPTAGIQDYYTLNTNQVGINYYRVRLSSDNKVCTDSSRIARVEIVSDPSVSSITRDTGLCDATSINLQGNATGGIAPLTYQWQSGTSTTGPWTDINGAKNSSYNASLQKGKNYYRLQIQSQGLGCTDFQSNGITITVDEKPSLSLDLKDKILCLGALDTLIVNAKGNNVSYTWRSSPNPTGPFMNPGINSNSLVPLTNQVGILYYFVALTSENNICKDTSALVKVEVVEDPKIILEPRDTSLCPGKFLELLAMGNLGIAPLNYQWQSSNTPSGPWTDISSATLNKLTVNTTNTGSQFFRVMLKSNGRGCDDAFSRVVEVKVNATVAVTQQPQNISQCIGGNGVLTIQANGNNKQYQWQSSKDGKTWTNIAGATTSQHQANSTTKDSIYYRCIVIDPANADCGTDTSKSAIVVNYTDFKVRKDTIEVCNFNDGISSTKVDFSQFISSGDKNASWQIIQGNLPPGSWSAKDFNGYTPGTLLKFVATTTDQIAPCLNVSDTIIIKIKQCCPTVCTKPINGVLCKQSNTPFDLNTLLCQGTQPGSWSLIAGPGITIPQNLINNQIVPSSYQAGIFTLRYSLTNKAPNCVDSSIQTITIVKAPSAGTKISNIVLCERKDTTLILGDYLTGEDNGGLWTSSSTQVQSQIIGSGQLNLQNLAAGNYTLKYKVSAQGCSSDSIFVNLLLNTLPFIDAGAGGRLTCDSPTVWLGNITNGSSQNEVLTWRLVGGALQDETKSRFESGNPGVYILTIQNNQTGCISRDTATIIAGESFITKVDGKSKDPVCYNEKNGVIEVTNIEGGTAPFQYKLSGSNGVNKQNTTGIFRDLADGSYRISIEDVNGCKTYRDYVIVNPDPLDIELERDTIISCRDSIYLRVNSGIDPTRIKSLQWYNAGTLIDTLPLFGRVLHPSSSTRYSIKVEDINGCLVERSAAVKVDISAHVFAPNVFSANGDNVNDLFQLKFSDNVDFIYSLELFDRWGELMYTKKDFYPHDPHGWNGVFRDQQALTGVYVWVAKIRACDDRIETIYGDVTLLR